MCGVSRDPICSSNGLYEDASFSHRDLVLYFRHQFRVKIRCDRKRLDRQENGERSPLVIPNGLTL